MKKKFAACCLALMAFILGVWISGVAIVSSYSQTGMEVALRRCNKLLYSKFQSGVFLYKISLRYIPKQTDLFSQRGFVEINFAGTDKVYDVPVKIDHGFLTMVTHGSRTKRRYNQINSVHSSVTWVCGTP